MRFFRLKKSSPTTSFYLNLCLVISLVVVAIYAGIYLRTNRLLLETVKEQARSYFDLIVRVRYWNASYGSMYVEKRGDVDSSPHLRGLGINPDILATDGRVLTQRNPAQMTREVSTILNRENQIQFHITSLKLLNKDNAPDEFEADALKSFEAGEREFFRIEQGEAGRRFRYMAPLLVEQSCLTCHAKFNYRVGDIRGGISVSIPLAKIEREMAVNRVAIMSLSVLTLVLLLGAAYLMLSHLVGKLDTAQQALHEASITDPLTGLRNRRYLMTRFYEEFERARRNETVLGVLMLDLDHFKGINDSCGHPFGDLVLQTIATAISRTMREYDVVARHGGEEFALLVPDTTHQALSALGERLRSEIEQTEISDQSYCIRVTASIGCTAITLDDSPETLLKRADTALYQAKHEGRNRVVLL